MIKIITILVFAFCAVNICTSQNQDNGPLDPQQAEYAEDYVNFTMDLSEALYEFEEKNELRADTMITNFASAPFGIGHILAVMNQKLWPAALPGFETLLKSAKNLPEAYSTLMSQILGSEIQISNTIYATDEVPSNPSLKTLKTDVKKVNLQSTDASTVINSEIASKVNNLIPYPYIPSKTTMLQSTKAILISTVHLSSAWPTPLAKVGTANFNGEPVDMYEIKGDFPYLESDDALQVTIPFKSLARALVLILPSDITAALRGEMAEPHNGTAVTVRVQFPLFDYTVRSSHKAGKTQNQCSFTKDQNLFRLLSDVVHVVATPDKFEAVSVTGAMVNDVAQFKTEVASLPPSSNPAATNNGDTKSFPKDKLARSDDSTTSEKLIIVDRPFQWRIDDATMGPIFFGTVESLTNNGKNDDDTTTSFGLDNLPYLSCL